MRPTNQSLLNQYIIVVSRIATALPVTTCLPFDSSISSLQASYFGRREARPTIVAEDRDLGHNIQEYCYQFSRITVPEAIFGSSTIRRTGLREAVPCSLVPT